MRRNLVLLCVAAPALLVGATAALLGADWLVTIPAALSGGVAGGTAAWLGTRRLARGLWALERAGRAAAAGELDARVQLDGDDELGHLGHLFNQAAGAWGRQLERRQDESQTLLAVLDGMSEGVWVTDAKGSVIRHNRALKQLLFAGQELVGKRPLEILRTPELNEAVARACESGEPSTLELSVQGLRPRTLEVSVTPLRDIGGSAAVFHDITELRRLEKIRKDFVANVSHELRTPITAIRGYAETLKAGALQDQAHAGEMVEIIHRQSERLSELVGDLLELSRIEDQELRLELVEVRLAAVAQRALELVKQRAADRDLQLSLELSPELTALGDEHAVEQVFLNLLDNAVKYTPPRGRVRVTGERAGDRVRVAVADTGVGIEERHLPRVFERFYRVDKGRSRELGGTGLGLSIVKHLTQAMHGDIAVVSRVGQGSTFTVSLPAFRRPA